MENPGPHRQIMMDETRDKKNEGLRKRRRLDEAWTFPEATISRDGSGPAQLEDFPFQLHHIGVDLTDFWTCFN